MEQERVKAAPKSDGGNAPLKQGRIWCWNVNGLRAVLKKGDFTRFLEEAKPDVLCLNETKIDDVALEREGIKD